MITRSHINLARYPVRRIELKSLHSASSLSGLRVPLTKYPTLLNACFQHSNPPILTALYAHPLNDGSGRLNIYSCSHNLYHISFHMYVKNALAQKINYLSTINTFRSFNRGHGSHMGQLTARRVLTLARIRV